ncbi:MAG: radical SAM protein [Spirochaetes bacterium]|nr:radical SAM protein [Spirochaetota bacterium]
MADNKVDIKFGYLCNNKCRFCVQGNKRIKYGNLEKEEIIKKLEDGKKFSDCIVFTGGEVTIRDDFLDLLLIAKKLDYAKIQIQTNGRMFSNMSFCEKTVQNGANDFSLALHGHIPQLHDYLTSAEGSFYQTVKGIKNLKFLNQFVGTNTVITRSNYRNLPDIAALLVYLNVDQYQLAFVHPVGTAMEFFDSIVPRLSLTEQYVKDALTAGIKAGKTVMTEGIPFCFMEGFTGYIAESIMPEMKIFDVNVCDDYREYRIKEGKAKDKKCGLCRYDKQCEGTWREYPEKYGWDEFIPVK